MKICKIWDSEYPWDVRAEKVARTLTDSGHEVHLVARNRDGCPEQEVLPECIVHRIRPLPLLHRLPGLGRKMNAASMFPAFFNPRWIRKVTAVAKQHSADVILCRDLPLIPAAIWVGRRLGMPVILDMAENYPAMIRSIWDNRRQRLADWVVRNPALVEKVEHWAIHRVDHILVVVEESRDRLIGLGVSPERITVVSNTPPVNRATTSGARNATAGGPLELIYLGLLEAPRGIATLIDAMHTSRLNGINVRLTLIGDGRERKDFEDQARRLNLGDDVVRFLGYVPNSEALQLLRTANIGVIPHHADESWNTTIPNKLFDYMAAGIAVIGSDAPPVARIISDTGCGEVFRDRDATDLSAAIARLSEADYRHRCAELGRQAIIERYNWERDSERLLTAITAIGASVKDADGRPLQPR